MPARIQARLSSLKETCEKFSLVHETIGLAMTKLTSEERLQLRQHSYFLDKVYSNTYEVYLDSIEKITSLLEFDSESNNGAPSTQTSSQTSSVSLFFHHARELTFRNGLPQDLLSFKDLFSSLILAKPSLTAVEKLQYLKTSLVGSASHLLKNTALTADNFQTAGRH